MDLLWPKSIAKTQIGETDAHLHMQAPRCEVLFWDLLLKDSKIVRYNLQRVELEGLELACISIALCHVACKSTSEVTVRRVLCTSSHIRTELKRFNWPWSPPWTKPPILPTSSFLPERQCNSGLSPITFTVHLIPGCCCCCLSRGPAVHGVALVSEWQGDAVGSSEALSVEELLWNPAGSFL